jgi:oligopeptide transport system substrate-binding protein
MRTFFVALSFMLLLADSGGQYGGTLNLGYTVDMQTLDPHRINVFYDDFDLSIAVVNQVFEGLVSFKSGTAEIEPLLAESWDVSENGLVYTFHLRKNVYWQDGNDVFPEGKSRNLNAQDVEYSWNRAVAPDTLCPMRDFYYDTAKIDTWKATGSYTFQVTLKQPNPGFLYMLPFPCFSVVPEEIDVRYGKEEFSLHAVGTGPYEVVQKSPPVLRYNEDYWEGEPYVTEIHFTSYKPEELLTHFQNGTLDWWLVPSDQWEEFSSSISVRVPRLEILYLGMNCHKSPFYDVRVRQAINYALDPGAGIESIYQGKAVRATTILPEGLVCHKSREDFYGYDPEKAKALLEECGYTGEPRLTIELKSSESYIQQQFNALYKEQLAEVGVDLEVTYLDIGSLLNAVDTGDTQMFTLGWYADWPYPDQFLFLFHSSTWGPGGNGSFYANQEVDTLLEKARKEPDIDTACQLYQEAEDIILQDSVWVLQWRRVDGYAVQEWIQGFNPGPMGTKFEKLNQVWISDSHRQTTRIPENVEGPSSGIGFCAGTGILVVAWVLLVIGKRIQAR